jgi:hypothetical protein
MGTTFVETHAGSAVQSLTLVAIHHCITARELLLSVLIRSAQCLQQCAAGSHPCPVVGPRGSA